MLGDLITLLSVGGKTVVISFMTCGVIFKGMGGCGCSPAAMSGSINGLGGGDRGPRVDCMTR